MLRLAMGPRDKLAARVKAIESLQRLYLAADECGKLHLKAGMPLPKEVSLLMTWGEEEARAEEQAAKPALLSIQPPFPVPEKGWISVSLEDCQPVTIAPAVLRDDAPLTVGELTDKVRALGVGTSEGSIANIATKLVAAGTIERSASGLRLASAALTAKIVGGRLWGPAEVFQDSDVAAHRREAVLAYLQTYGKLSRAQIITLLQQSDWVNAPINMYLVKADLQALQAKKLARRAKSDDPRNWDWELIKKRGQLKLANVAG